MNMSVDALCVRLREVPESFLPPENSKLTPMMKGFVSDTLLHISGQLPEAAVVQSFDHSMAHGKKNPQSLKPNARSMILLAVWLFNDTHFKRLDGSVSSIQSSFLNLIEQRIKPLSRLVEVMSVVEDGDRREEFVRLCLSAMSLSIEGESESQSVDRLQTLDSVARHQLIQAAQKQRKEAERQRRIEEEARRKKQQEQAARYNREW